MMYKKDINKVLEDLVMNEEVEFDMKILNILYEIIEELELDTPEAVLVLRYLKERSQRNVYNKEETDLGFYQNWKFYLNEYHFYVKNIINIFPIRDKRKLMFPEDIIDVNHNWTRAYQEEKTLREKATLKTITKQKMIIWE